MQPWGIWVCYHQPLIDVSLAQQYQFNRSIAKAWFLNQGHIIQKPLSQYIRFYLVQIVQTWCSKTIPEKNPIFGVGKYDTGLVNFVRIEESVYYLHWQFGGCLGEAFTFKINERRKLINRQVIFIS